MRKNKESREEIIIKIIQNDPEGTNVDYKWKFYDLNNEWGKSEFIKDIAAFANCIESGDKFIIFGVKEKYGYPDQFQSLNIEWDDSKLQEILHSHIEPKIRFELKKISFKDNLIYYIRIFNNENKPYLFKKKIANFEEGDGVIRIGTKTGRLQRSDYDYIYLHRNKPGDRKRDLKIEIVTDYSDDENIKAFGLKCLDVNVSNLSNQSLIVEYEIKIFKSDCITFFTEDCINEIIDNLSKPKSFLSHFSPRISRFDINFVENKDYFIISKSVNSKVSISQKETFKFIFGKYLFFDLKEETCKVHGEIIFRSDSFTKGPFVKKFKYKIVQ